MIGIYKITTPSGKIYIGQSMNIPVRWKAYKYAFKNKPSLINRSIMKHGYMNHLFEVVHELPADIKPDVLTKYEQLYLDQYTDCGFIMLNICPAAGSTYGFKMSEDAKLKMHYAHKNRKPISDETRKKISEFHKGKPKSEEQKRKLSEHFKGFKHTEETKIKMSLSGKGRKQSAETKIKISIAKKGKKASDDARKKMSEAQKSIPRKKGRKHTEQTKQVLREKAVLQKRNACSEKQKGQISKANKGAYRSAELRKRISEGVKIYYQKKKENAV